MLCDERLLRWGLLRCFLSCVMCCMANNKQQKADNLNQDDTNHLSGVTDGQGSRSVLGNKVPISRIGERGAMTPRQGDSVWAILKRYFIFFYFFQCYFLRLVCIAACSVIFSLCAPRALLRHRRKKTRQSIVNYRVGRFRVTFGVLIRLHVRRRTLDTAYYERVRNGMLSRLQMSAEHRAGSIMRHRYC